MEVVNSLEKELTNFEVNEFLQKTKNERNEKKVKEITIQIDNFMKMVAPELRDVDRETIKKLLQDLTPFGISTSEKVEILNLLPRDIRTLKLILFREKQKYTENDLDNIIKIIEKYFPR